MRPAKWILPRYSVDRTYMHRQYTTHSYNMLKIAYSKSAIYSLHDSVAVHNAASRQDFVV